MSLKLMNYKISFEYSLHQNKQIQQSKLNSWIRKSVNISTKKLVNWFYLS